MNTFIDACCPRCGEKLLLPVRLSSVRFMAGGFVSASYRDTRVEHECKENQ